MHERRSSVKHTNGINKSTDRGSWKKSNITYEDGNKKRDLNSDVARREGGPTTREKSDGAA